MTDSNKRYSACWSPVPSPRLSYAGTLTPPPPRPDTGVHAMSFDEEWASARATASANVAMRLNHVP
ncbi:hypothetical protein ACFCV9_40895, partial [Streptomyces sp. NPDC056367]